ncbi:hypothetical protein [Enterococcus sp. AZ072]
MELEEAVQQLWQKDIYAESDMGCTGPVILVNEQKDQSARQALTEANYL